MSRIELNDTMLDAVVKMADGNPGAIMALTELIKHNEEIDPQAAFGALSPVMMLDTYEIYGSSIYVLFSDKCDRDVRKFIMLIRATQLGIFPFTKLKEMAADQLREMNLTDDEWNTLDTEVCNLLDDFKRAS